MEDLSHSNHISSLGITMRQSLVYLIIQNEFISIETILVDFKSLSTVQ